MKIALCLSGQPRVVEVGFQKLNETILQHNDVDVFIHTWFDPENLSTQSVIPGMIVTGKQSAIFIFLYS